ncbi:lactonase family protein [Solihabitans fulvus]|uniref:Lactonase family protein n=1 Tax=Solihabitans fulvus TaxID=1892852 RepID=A0A5B2XBX6_9PSEU|nr:lactonase family protein [Solihabitans fulvus]
MDRRRFLGLVGAGVGAGLLMGEGIGAAESGSLRTGGHRVYLGTYTSGAGAGTGVGLASYQPATGQLRSTGVLAGVANPSFLTLSADGRTLYAVDEQTDGSVTALAVDAAGGLRVLGTQSSGGADPCHLAVHADGRHLLSANYSSGSVAVHPIHPDGSLGARTDLVQHKGSGPDPDRQAGPHAHMVCPDPGGRFVLAVDLGTDTVYSYRLDPSTGRLKPRSTAALRPGAGPRHLAFHTSGRFAYVVNELDSTIVVCAYDPATGVLRPGKPQATVPAGAPASPRNYPAEVLVAGDGRFVYVSNRGHDSVAVFAVEAGGGTLRLLGATPVGGSFPRHISVDPTGRILFAANQKSNTVTSFLVDRQSGALTPSGTPLSTPIPVCVLPAKV